MKNLYISLIIGSLALSSALINSFQSPHAAANVLPSTKSDVDKISSPQTPEEIKEEKRPLLLAKKVLEDFLNSLVDFKTLNAIEKKIYLEIRKKTIEEMQLNWNDKEAEAVNNSSDFLKKQLPIAEEFFVKNIEKIAHSKRSWSYNNAEYDNYLSAKMRHLAMLNLLFRNRKTSNYPVEESPYKQLFKKLVTEQHL